MNNIKLLTLAMGFCLVSAVAVTPAFADLPTNAPVPANIPISPSSNSAMPNIPNPTLPAPAPAPAPAITSPTIITIPAFPSAPVQQPNVSNPITNMNLKSIGTGTGIGTIIPVTIYTNTNEGTPGDTVKLVDTVKPGDTIKKVEQTIYKGRP